MAIDMGCKPDAVIATATELMSFVMGGAASPPATVAGPQAPDADAIAALWDGPSGVGDCRIGACSADRRI